MDYPSPLTINDMKNVSPLTTHRKLRMRNKFLFKYKLDCCINVALMCLDGYSVSSTMFSEDDDTHNCYKLHVPSDSVSES